MSKLDHISLVVSQDIPVWKRAGYLAAAGLWFALGVLGILLPGLPATPFLLLTSYCLVRSSPRLNAALLNSRCFGPILADWQIQGGVRRSVKIKSIAVVAVAVSLTICFASVTWILKLLVVVLAGVGIGVIVRLPGVEGSSANRVGLHSHHAALNGSAASKGTKAFAKPPASCLSSKK